ncbi:MAG: hypothetical protein P1U58_14525 [Verrucomicrobiales bacterium]|nr:hypothetical protein [Verrucomicrobiales bacterium]
MKANFDAFLPLKSTMKSRALFPLVALFLCVTTATNAQLRRPGIVMVEREDRTSSRLNKEKGAIYLEEMIQDPVPIQVTKQVAAYSNLSGERWLGNLVPNKNAVLLAVSEKAYRVRALAKQGQIAGWVSKAAIAGLPPEFEENLRLFHERYVIVNELIDNHQVALGMTVGEVTTSIGPPDRRSSKVTQEGQTATLEYISYERIPQTTVSYDAFGQPFASTQYIEVESGKVRIEFVNDTVTSIEESEGINFGSGGGFRTVPTPVFLF